MSTRAKTKPRSKEYAAGSDIAMLGQDISAAQIDKLIDLTYGSLKLYNDKFAAKSLEESIEQSLKFAKGGSDLISSAIEVKLKFFCAGFAIKLEPGGRKSASESTKSKFSEFNKKHRINRICKDLMFDYISTDNCVLHWLIKDNEITWITTLPPHTIRFVDSPNGPGELKVIITQELRNAIRESIKNGNSSAWSAKFIKAVTEGKSDVLLKNEDGEYWCVRSSARRFTGLAMPSMQSVFADIQLRNLLIAGDWSTAFFMKNFITQVSSGETITHGPRSGTKDLYVTKEEILKLQEQFKKIGQTLRIYTNHTVKIQQHIPDPKILSGEKYLAVEKRICRWHGVIDTMMTGEGDGFSQGTIGRKRFEVEGMDARDVITEMFKEFYEYDEVASAIGIAATSEIKTTWNNQVLKDPKQILDEIRFLNESGLLDVRTIHEAFGFDHEEVKARKGDDEGERELWVPVFEKAQGILTAIEGLDSGGATGGSGAPGGRPAKKGGTQPPQPPRPSRGNA